MLRRLFTLLAVGSLLLCLAVVALWVRSYWLTARIRQGAVAPGGGWQETRFISDRGRIGWWRVSGDAPLRSSGRLRFEEAAPLGPDRWTWGFRRTTTPAVDRWEVFGVVVERFHTERDSFQRDVWAPHAMIVSALLVAPACWAGRVARDRRATRRSRAGLCPACGYDLRATTGHCPECGAVTKGASP
ncbi:MAG TPA: hypothetical protein VF796_26585 [Humisphaera sp.]